MKKIGWLGGFIALMITPLWVWISVEGNPLTYITHPVPAGQALYIFSKLVGLYAFTLLWLHVVWVILRNTQLGYLLPRWQKHYHQTMGISITVIILMHVTLFISAVSLRKESFAYNLLLPNFSDYYHSLLSLGLLALWLLPVVIYAGFKLRVDATKRWLHRLGFILFTLIFFHGIGVGSETKSGIMLWMYLSMGVSVPIALLMRWLNQHPKNTSVTVEN